MKIVNKRAKVPKHVGLKYNDRELTYKDIKAEEDGWVDPHKYLPLDYDLVQLKIDKKYPVNGWLSGGFWEGLRLKSNDKVIGWKLNKGEEYAFS